MDFRDQLDSLLQGNNIDGFIVFCSKPAGGGSMSIIVAQNNVQPQDVIGGLELVQHGMMNNLLNSGDVGPL
jgi:hypothetical protein